MKTLSELIKAFEYCLNPVDNFGNCNAECPYIHCCDPSNHDVTEDALHYLKEYQKDKQIYSYDIVRRNMELSEKNDPLTWDELRAMEGKPVWVEILSDEIDLSSRWMMVARETKAHSLPLAYTDDIGHWIYGHEDKLGKTWQAYRKERE